VDLIQIKRDQSLRWHSTFFIKNYPFNYFIALKMSTTSDRTLMSSSTTSDRVPMGAEADIGGKKRKDRASDNGKPKAKRSKLVIVVNNNYHFYSNYKYL